MAVNKIKILKFVTSFYIGGTERQFAHVVQQLDPARFDLSVACFLRTGKFLPLIESRGIPLHEFRIKPLYHPATWRTQLDFLKYLRRERFDVVHSYGLYPNLFTIPAARLAGVPVVIASIRDTGEMLEGKQRWVQKQACRWATSVLANADAVRNQLVRDGYAASKVFVIRNGIVPLDLTLKTKGGPVHREFGLPENARILAVVARLARIKGIRYLLEAMPAIVAQNPDAHLLIVGDGREKAALEAHAAALGILNHTTFTGLRLDVHEILSEVTLSVLPSLSEGLSNVLIESMSAGIPVVSTRVGGNPEIVEDKITGLLVPPENPGALAEAINALLGNPVLAAGMGKAGRERFERRFSLARAIRETEEFYVRSLNGKAHLAPQEDAV